MQNHLQKNLLNFVYVFTTMINICNFKYIEYNMRWSMPVIRQSIGHNIL